MNLTRETARDYYRRVAPFLLYHLKNVPVSFKRYPDSLDGEFFWEKDAPGFTPGWVRTFPVPRRDGQSDIHYILLDDERTLLWLVEVGGIEIHPFLHRVPRIERATSIVFDLDPGDGATLADCCEVALLLREIVGNAHAKVSGSKGMQVYVPTDRTHAETEAYARAIAEELARKHPSRITAKMAKADRAGKVFIDYSQNADYKTTVAVYSLRAHTGLVSMPVTWEEVGRGRGLAFTAEEAVRRLEKVGDLWTGLRGSGVAKLRSAPARPATAQPRNLATLLPKPRSQSGRRLYIRTDKELWLDMGGKFKCFGEGREMEIDPKFYRGEVPRGWRAGAYELMNGSFERGRMELWLEGEPWLLERGSTEWTLRSHSSASW